ncbi:hypothetical protein B296_00034390 [Ensete ventricosum]|uniref:Uncharacterized protein n=1 Tax=Ensete ventricosum TaxID=4639 RepID=A0A426YQP4_ENSVE|nr:hypothetical protein B296_00034390 [Ensete ventricosum]
MGSAASWHHRVGTSVELSIPCSHGGRALVVKGAKEVENVEVNSKYQDKAKEQRPRNIISQCDFFSPRRRRCLPRREKERGDKALEPSTVINNKNPIKMAHVDGTVGHDDADDINRLKQNLQPKMEKAEASK